MGVTLTDVLLFGKAQSDDVDNATLVIYRRNILRWGAIATAVDVVVRGIPPLSLVGAVADSLTSLKAFGGTEQGGVPSGYTAVEYVENTTNTMVKTAIHIGNDDNFKIDITATAVTGSFYLFQARDKVNSSLGNANITGISGATSGNTLLASPGIDGVAVSNGLTRVNRTGHKMRFVYECADGNITWYVRDLDGNVENTATGTYDPTQLNRATTNMCIYGNEAPAGSGSGQQANRLAPGCKVYGAKLWKNGILVLDYVPATRDSDSAIGFYDKISDTFVTAADGSLTAGSSLAPTPSDPVDLVCNNGKISVLDHTNWNVITNPTSQTGKGMFISSDGKLQKANDRGAGVFIPITVGKQYTLLINKKTTALGSIIRYGQSNNGDLPNSAEQLLDWYRGAIEDTMMISFTAKRPYFVMQLAAILVEAGGIDEAVEVIESAGDNETIAITDEDNTTVCTATANNLFAINTYKDVQEIITGATIRNCGVYVFNGTENFETATATNCYSLTNTLGTGNFADRTIVCSHFASTPTMPGTDDRQGLAFIVNKGQEYTIAFGATTQFSTQALWQQFLADQYANGTPVIVVYTLATPYTEPAPIAQSMTVVDGDNLCSLIQQGMTPLTLEATYTAGVSVTITEIENANIGNDVDVVIA